MRAKKTGVFNEKVQKKRPKIGSRFDMVSVSILKTHGSYDVD